MLVENKFYFFSLYLYITVRDANTCVITTEKKTLDYFMIRGNKKLRSVNAFL